MALASVGQVPILADSLFRSPDPAKRAASLMALLDLGWRIPPERLDYLLTDGYFMVEAITADVSGIEYSMPEGTGLPEDLPPLQEVPDAVRIVTDAGEFTMELLKDHAPLTCRSFWHLAEGGFYQGIYFHRVIPGFVAQAGCPEGNGYGGPGYTIPAEHNTVPYRRGTVGMADSGPNTGGSQFFIMLDSHRRLDCRYTAFGVLRDAGGADHIETGTVILEILPVNP
jgi:peptidyl-prolyl cis-trans isomerase B (cyclophilin B)